MTTKSEKPYVLRAAEFVYSKIIEIKKQIKVTRSILDLNNTTQ